MAGELHTKTPFASLMVRRPVVSKHSVAAAPRVPTPEVAEDHRGMNAPSTREMEYRAAALSAPRVTPKPAHVSTSQAPELKQDPAFRVLEWEVRGMLTGEEAGVDTHPEVVVQAKGRDAPRRYIAPEAGEDTES